MGKIVFILSLMMAAVVGFIPLAQATCSVGGCTVGMLGKSKGVHSESQDKKWYFRYIYDQLVWQDRDSHEIHELHHDGHDVHNKTTDVTHHYQIGRHITEDFNITIDLPYVIKSSLEIHEHDLLGAKQRAEGLGDLQLLSEYRLWHNEQAGLGLAGGFQFPTGSTKEKNLQGERFETESQPGSGAYNYILGGFYKWNNKQLSMTANTSYVITTEGAQDFEYGDLYTASLEALYTLNPDARSLKTQIGADILFQNSSEEKTRGVKNADSGGQMLWLGPSLKIALNEDISLTGLFLCPVSQQLNGLAQEADFNWTLGTQVRF